MKRSPLLALSLLLVSLVACDSAPTSPPNGSVTSLLHSRASTAASGAIVVRGEVSTPSGNGRRILTIDALQTPSGNVKGSYRVDITASGLFFEVEVSCVAGEGNTAWIGGIISATNSAAIRVGSVSYFYIRDNGSPHPVKAFEADVMSTARINDAVGQDLAFCATRPLALPTLGGLEGDISVR